MIARMFLASVLLWVPAALAAPRTFTIDERASTATAHVGKTGIASFAGHEHDVVAQNLQGEVVLDAEDLSRSSVDLIVDARSLKVSEKGEPEGDAPKVQQAMRGTGVLDIARYPTISFRSSAVTGKQGAGGVYEVKVDGEIKIHGVAKRIAVPVRVEVRGDALTATGKMVVKLPDFRIEPTSAAGGLVKVDDEVGLSFRIEARAAKP